MKALTVFFLALSVMMWFGALQVCADDPSQEVFEEGRPEDVLKPEELVGFTGMVRYTYRDWSEQSRDNLGDFEFDSFRLQAQTTLEDRYYGSVQYRFYDGWQALHHLWIATAGLRSFWKRMDLFLEVYYGRNDPQLSGNASGYGRDAGVTDMRIDFRVFYHLNIRSR